MEVQRMELTSLIAASVTQIIGDGSDIGLDVSTEDFIGGSVDLKGENVDFTPVFEDLW